MLKKLPIQTEVDSLERVEDVFLHLMILPDYDGCRLVFGNIDNVHAVRSLPARDFGLGSKKA